MLEQIDDYYSELTYNEPKPRKFDFGAGTLHTKFFFVSEFYHSGPWRSYGRNIWFKEKKMKPYLETSLQYYSTGNGHAINPVVVMRAGEVVK